MLASVEVRRLVKLAQEGDEEAKNALIAENSPLIKSIIKRFVKAIKNFNADFNVKFSTYVVPMVIDEIKRFMRDDGMIKVSRAIKSLNIKVNKFVDAYYSENKVKPSIETIAKHFNVDEGDIVMAMDSSRMPVSLYSPLEDDDEDGLMLIDRVDCDKMDEALINKITIRQMLSSLPKRSNSPQSAVKRSAAMRARFAICSNARSSLRSGRTSRPTGKTARPTSRI